ncbi:MAG: periplasmic heavy metal sensor [Pseudomonadota bacterium]
MAETDTSATEPVSRSPLWVRILLFVSLAANLLIIGVVTGAVLTREPQDRQGDPRLRDVGLGPLGFVLEQDDRKALRQDLARSAPKLRESRVAGRAAMARLLEELRSDTFDPAVVVEVFEIQRQAAGTRAEVGQAAVARRLAEMSLEERRRLADRIEKGMRRHGGPRGN